VFHLNEGYTYKYKVYVTADKHKSMSLHKDSRERN